MSKNQSAQTIGTSGSLELLFDAALDAIVGMNVTGHEQYKELATTTAQFAFTKGQGLPGRIWESGEPEWVTILATDPNLPRAPFFAAVALKRGFGFPVGRDNLKAVLEFFSTQILEPEHHLILTVKTISELVTRGFERLRTTERTSPLGYGGRSQWEGCRSCFCF